jgi:two-component system, NarL family, sensor histidine kinase UhpB
MGATAHPAWQPANRPESMTSTPDPLTPPADRNADGEVSPQTSDEQARRSGAPRRAVPMLWRVFAANAAVFALAFALLALAPVTLHASIRLDELVLLLVGLVVMLLVDLLLLRQALGPLSRLSRVMRKVDLLHPGQRAVGFERSSTELQDLAEAFNEMLERLEDERRRSSGRVLAAQEAERLRIARELHDEIGQTLTAVALRAEHRAEQARSQHPEFAELAEIVQQSLADVRRISLELRPGALDELGLINALISLCARVENESSLRVRRALEGPIPALPRDVELAVYRIAQEALTNVMRHSGASEVDVALTCTDDQLMLSVHDNGRGLPEDVRGGGGLTGMRERAMLVGADLDVSTNAGVSVTLRLPLKQGNPCPPR